MQQPNVRGREGGRKNWQNWQNWQNVAAACAANDKREPGQASRTVLGLHGAAPKGCLRRDMHVKLRKAKL